MTPQDDKPLDLATCESEPIRIPGFIQPHGVLLALDETNFCIEQVSENCTALLGLSPAQLIGNTPAAFLAEHHFERLAASFGARPFEAGSSEVVAGPQQEAMECNYSRYRGSLVIELQPTSGAHTLDELDVSIGLQAPLSRMERTTTVDDLLACVAKEIRAISGFDRVMVYRFDEDWHGKVLAEDVSDRLPIAYLGLNFPESDIPAQARDLYLLNTLRLIPDTQYVPVPIVPVDNPRRGAPLDLSRSDLRSVSPIHLEYLRNIGVRATLTISIVVHGKLWGLVACHHDSPRRLNLAVRSTCSFFAQMLALKLTARIDHARLSERLSASDRIVEFVAGLESTNSIDEALRRNWEQLLSIFNADALIVGDSDGYAAYGTSLPADDMQPVIARLAADARDGIASSSSLRELDERAHVFATEASGALYVGLSIAADRYVVFIRREERATVKWAGDPNKAKVALPGATRLSPRASFQTWEEKKFGVSLRWSASDMERAKTLREHLMHWQRAGEGVRQLAHYDTLTELPNRRLLDELLRRSLAEADARNKQVAVLFVDIDRFKRFNDRLGHAAGDRVLRHTAARMSRAVREGDIVGRLGGDEFVVIVPAISDRYVAEAVAQRLLDEVTRPIPGFEGHDLRVTVSIGMSYYPSDGATNETLLNKADAAMYRVKENGRSAFQRYESAQSGPPSPSSERTKRVAEALDRSEIVAHYQPILHLSDGRIVAVEALARWNHPVSGLLGPAAFIEIAEESDLIIRLGTTMLDIACAQVRRWRRTTAADLRVAVNVSPRQLREFGFVELVRKTLARYDLPAQALELEITEGMVVGDTSTSIDALEELAASGVRIAIDDFGTGYSSFNYLRRLPVNALKIDQSFIAELAVPETRESGAAIIRAIASMAKSLELEVVGEGVETQAQLDLLRIEGCDFAQGYHIGRPLNAANYPSFSSDSAWSVA